MVTIAPKLAVGCKFSVAVKTVDILRTLRILEARDDTFHCSKCGQTFCFPIAFPVL